MSSDQVRNDWGRRPVNSAECPSHQCVLDATGDVRRQHRLGSRGITFKSAFKQLLVLARRLFASEVQGEHLVTEISIVRRGLSSTTSAGVAKSDRNGHCQARHPYRAL